MHWAEEERHNVYRLENAVFN
uniref:Uncharacterized protein n=1 Tax=Arundo donax TaxID=35708 RepID=A0A0A9BAC5_ARUDO